MTLQIKSIRHNPFIQILCIGLTAFCITLLPFFAMRIPPSQMLSSDAEWYVAHWEKLAQPDLFKSDVVFSLQTTQPYIDFWGQCSNFISKTLHITLLQWTITFSFIVLLVFLVGLYVLLRICLHDSLLPFIITLISIIPVHQLGGTTFGFPPSGFLPRDIALALSFLPIIYFIRTLQTKNTYHMNAVFFCIGALGNLYPLLFFHLGLLLILTHIIIRRGFDGTVFINGLSFLIGAFPTLAHTLSIVINRYQLDTFIYQRYYHYMLPGFFTYDFFQYIRRSVFSLFIITILYIFIFRKAKGNEKLSGRIWYAMAFISSIFMIFGIIVEHSPVYAEYLLSRYSIWLTLSSLIIMGLAVRILIVHLDVRRRTFVYGILAFVLILQSNAPTTYRTFTEAYKNRANIISTYLSLQDLEKNTSPQDVIVAPVDEYDDIAQKIRAYSRRSVYIAYKDGAFSMGNGEIAQIWAKRTAVISKVFQTKNPAALLSFMKSENIQYAFVPVRYYDPRDILLQSRTIRTNDYLIIKL